MSITGKQMRYLFATGFFKRTSKGIARGSGKAGVAGKISNVKSQGETKGGSLRRNIASMVKAGINPQLARIQTDKQFNARSGDSRGNRSGEGVSQQGIAAKIKKVAQQRTPAQPKGFDPSKRGQRIEKVAFEYGKKILDGKSFSKTPLSEQAKKADAAAARIRDQAAKLPNEADRMKLYRRAAKFQSVAGFSRTAGKNK